MMTMLADALPAAERFDQHILFYSGCVFSTIVGAIAGATASTRVHMDLIGIIVCGTIASLGGGTVRDILLQGYTWEDGSPLKIYWLTATDVQFLYQALITSLVVFYISRFWRIPVGTIRVADAFSMAFFTILGAAKSYHLGCSWAVCIAMGVCTGVAGGILRDVLTGNVPYVFRSKEVYASAAFAGAALYVLLQYVGIPEVWGYVAGVAAAFGVRMIAVYMNWRLPSYRPLLETVRNTDHD